MRCTCLLMPHPLKPLYGQFAGAPGVGPFHHSEEAMPDRLDAPLVARIVTVNDDVAAAQLDPVANLSIEAVHRRFLTGVAVPVIINCDASKAFASGAVTGASQVTNAVAKPHRTAARNLGLAVPTALVARANDVIE